MCDCGNEKYIKVGDLAKTKSCGCHRIRMAEEKRKTHGLSKTPLHSTWCRIKAKCYNPKHKDYKYYGERGIEVCQEWLDDFINFYNWSIENGWRKGLTIDRIDNNGNYCPNNCRWTTQKVQNNNTRANVIITAFGEEKNIYEWSIDPRCVVSYIALRKRIQDSGWNPEEAITSPVIELSERSPRQPTITAFGQTKRRKEWIKDGVLIVPLTTFTNRIARGWPVEKAMTTPSRPKTKKEK